MTVLTVGSGPAGPRPVQLTGLREAGLGGVLSPVVAETVSVVVPLGVLVVALG